MMPPRARRIRGAPAPDSETRAQTAVALRYRDNDQTPTVVASGAGELAKRILALAHEHNVPVFEHSVAAEILSKLRIGAAITPDTFRVVAEIISFLYHTDEEWRRERESSHK